MISTRQGFGCVAAAGVMASSLGGAPGYAADDWVWIDATNLTIEGQGWKQTESSYDRLPAKAKGVVAPGVWARGRDASGVCVRFLTDTGPLHVRWTLTGPVVSHMHMPPSAVSGVDLYIKKPDGSWWFQGNGKPSPDKQVQQAAFHVNRGVPVRPTECRLYLPLYNGVSKVELGVPAGRTLGCAPDYPVAHRKPIVFNGHSIVQGGCASRPGMSATALVGRHLNYPVINLGFSAYGHMEPEMADLLVELDASIYVIDTLCNMSREMVEQRAEPFIRRLRQAHAETPIVLVGVSASGNDLIPGKEQLAQIHAKLKAAGYAHIYYLTGNTMLGYDGEATVDLCHLTDLGFERQARAYEAAIEPALLAARFRRTGGDFGGVLLDRPPRPAETGVAYVRRLLAQAECQVAAQRELLAAAGKLSLVEEWLRKAKAYVAANDYAAALEALRLDPDSPYARTMKADIMTEFVAAGWRMSKFMPKTGAYAAVSNAPYVELGDPAMGFAPVEPASVAVNGLVSVHDRYPEQDGLVYLGLRFKTPVAGLYALSLGHDGGMRMFLDGREALCVPERQNPCLADRSVAVRELAAGEHELMVALDTAKGMGWGIRFRFLVPENEPQIMAAFPEALTP